MKIKIDHESDVLYFRLKESKIVDSEEIKPGIIIDYNEANEVVGFEVLNISKNIPAESLKNIAFETA